MNLIINIFLLLLVKALFCKENENRISDEQRLLKKILNNYDSLARPTFNASHSVEMKFQLSLIQIYKLDDVNQVLTTDVWLGHEWKDERLCWDPKDYGGIKVLRLPSEKLWLPDILLYNNAGDFTSRYLQTKAVINNAGDIIWITPVRFKSRCKIDVTYFPSDVQSCSMIFGSWTYDSSQLNLVERQNNVDTSNYVHSGEWKLISVHTKRSETKYPCCNETYPDITFTIVMKRQTLYYLFNIILPCLWLTILSLLSFWLPPDSGEKITLGITVLLGFSVFALLISDKMPANRECVPLIGIYLTVIMATTSLSIILTVLVLHIHYIGQNHKKIPKKLRHLFFDTLAPILGMTTISRCKIRKQNNESINRDCNISKLTMLNSLNSKSDNNTYDNSNTCPSSSTPPIEKNGNKSDFPNGMEDNIASDLNLMLQRTNNQYSEIIRHFYHLKEKRQKNESDEEMMSEWKMMAYILDRCLFWIFAALAGTATIVVLLIMPMLK